MRGVWRNAGASKSARSLAMARISKDQNVVTLISVFTVAPDRQQELVDLLVEATEKVMSKQPGYVSANIHKGLDGTTVANYAQWRSREAFEAIFRNPEATAHMEKIAGLAKFEAHVYEVAYTDEAP